MFTVALKGIAGRKVRALLTAIAIVLGVAMISGTYILTDTINNGFNTIVTNSYKNADVVISGEAAFKNTNGNGVETPTFPQDVLTKVKALPDVAAAAGAVQSDSVKLIGKNGKVIDTGGAPSLGFSIDPTQQQFNPTQLTAGSWPQGGDQVVIDKATASNKGFAVGDPIRIQAVGPQRSFRISGIAELAGVGSIGGATFAIFDLPTAQKFFAKQGQLDIIRISSKSGVSTSQLISQIQPLLPPTAVVRDANAQVKEDKKQFDIAFLQYILLAFAGIALFVGAFVIANTLSITIAQRMREFATLRTLGASRRQVMWSVIVEAFVIGVVGSVIGLFLGLALAKGLNKLFVTFGIDLPQGQTVFATRTVIVSLLVGTIVTLVASIRPARRATRVPPIAAVREGSVLPVSRFAKYGPVTALVVLVVAIAAVSFGTLGSGIATGPRLLLLGVGVLLLFFGVSMNAARVVRPLAAVLGAPARSIGGAPGILARDNATRNPARTASTASALMIGLALVTFVAIFSAGVFKSFEDAVDQLFIADYAVTATNTFTGIDVAVGKSLVGKPGVSDVTPIRQGSGHFLGSDRDISGVQPNIATGVKIDWRTGPGTSTPSKLGTDGFFTNTDLAKKHHLKVGSTVILEFPSGQKRTVRLKGTYKEPNGGSPFGDATISTQLFDKEIPRPKDLMVLVRTPDGVSDANTATLEDNVKPFADAKVQTRTEFKDNFLAPVKKIINLLYALLALAVIVSLVGIINTLVLTIFERTRELGMLRAVGMTRRQVRMMIRYESIVTSLMGATLGLIIGVFLAALVAQALKNEGVAFTIPWVQLIYFIIAAIIVGVLAAVIPARRAARLNVLQALQYE